MSENLERYREALDAWNRRDLVWILEQAAPDLEFNTAQIFPGIEPVYHGREGMVEFWTTFIEEPWALFRLDVDEIQAVSDDRVLALITFHGTERDSGEEVVRDYAHLATFRGDEVSRIDAFDDWDDARKAAGIAARAVLQHVSIEIDPALVDDMVEFWRLLGFEPVDSPEALGGYVTWLERQGTQIHLIHTEAATVPVLGHAAVVVDDHRHVAARRGPAMRSRTRASCGARRGHSRSDPGATASS